METSSTSHSLPFGEPDGLVFPPLYATLQREQPLARIRMAYGGDAWLVTRYGDVKTVLSDTRFSRAATVGADVPRVTPVVSQDTSILSMDPPEHTRLRKLVAKAFTARHIERLRPRVTEITHGLLDAMEAQGKPADLVQALARPLPISVICEMLGVPAPDHSEFRRWSDTIFGMASGEEIQSAFISLHSYVSALVAERRREPTDDVLGTLVQARDDGDRLTEAELVDFGLALLLGGFETTANQIANFAATLFQHPAHLAELRADPALVPSAVEELLRMVPLGLHGGFVRIATEDVELSGVVVRKGEAILAELHTANRDPEVFDRPEELDFHREHNPHLIFGYGPHHCVGAQLARLELQVALGTLLERFPALECAIPPEQIEFSKVKLVRGPETLPVTW
ncbi:cytochrome P450 [Streptomyces sp. NBC_01485]|uniref:cytochrome P450 n=1 Tax=Streptomyces sp. NBC_01485 TaxID=2903884 RepID=UPI002E315B13|nr:cytochrome P450 [Streptomyces sp. NBC_01485]